MWMVADSLNDFFAIRDGASIHWAYFSDAVVFVFPFDLPFVVLLPPRVVHRRIFVISDS